MVVNRGDVYIVRIILPVRPRGGGGERTKWVVLLQGGPAFASSTDVAVIVASTYHGDPLRPSDVLFGAAEGFDHDSVVDCRWPYTVLKSSIASGTYKFTLTPASMKRIALGLANGLQMTQQSQAPGPSSVRTK